MLFMENDGKILSHNAQVNTAFFSLSLLAAKGMQRPSGMRGGIPGSHFVLQGSISRGHQMTSRATNVAPNQPVVNREIRPRCLILAAFFRWPRPPSGAGKPQRSLEASFLQREHGRNPSLEIWSGLLQKRGKVHLGGGRASAVWGWSLQMCELRAAGAEIPSAIARFRAYPLFSLKSILRNVLGTASRVSQPGEHTLQRGLGLVAAPASPPELCSGVSTSERAPSTWKFME